MATIIQSVHAERASGSSSQVLTLPQAIAAGSTVVVLAGFGRNGAAAALTSVVDNAGTPNTYTVAVNSDANLTTAPNPRIHSVIAVKDNVTGGATSITATFSTSSSRRTFVSMFELGSLIPPSEHISGSIITQTTTPASGAPVTTTITSFIVSCVYTGAGTVSSVNSPWTSLAGSSAGMTAYQNNVSAASYQPTWTLSGNNRSVGSTSSFADGSGTNSSAMILLMGVN